ncbi:Uma2 family endonuclease [Zavarzinia sp. CC-PAN008]|uniref:Uma2 family endonuclease n=1 Tax=Zavarzinia sp. CC-PAN008 TaxID=3243332 RepID=UPI003F745739
MGAIRQPPPPRMDLEEFLAWDDGTDTRYELVRGEPLAMAPAREVHGQLAVAVGGELRAKLKRPCRVIGEAGIRVRSIRDTFLVADAAVTCAPSSPNAVFLTEPRIIIEVLSPSTQDHDRSLKLRAYRTLPTVSDIVLLSSVEILAEHWRRDGTGWHVEDLIGPDAALRLDVQGITLGLGDIYRDIDLTPDDAPDDPPNEGAADTIGTP